jgi:RimJ/RimL family protein N-acetyltransferase
MQTSWRADADKLTFISCLPRDPSDTVRTVSAGTGDAPDRLLGDVNLFLTKDEDDDKAVVGEVELMVATKSNQGRGYGRASLLAFLTYISRNQNSIVAEYLGSHDTPTSALSIVRVKIGKDNARSIKLFESVGFQKLSEVPNYFGEFELRLRATLESLDEKLVEQAQGFTELPYLYPEKPIS